MDKNQSVLHMKGIHTPEIFIWFHGLWHGKIIHSGGLDPETNCIASAYVTAQIKNFRNACILRFEKAERRLSNSWRQADELLIDYYSVTTALQNTFEHTRADVSRQNVRKIAAYKSEREKILKKLAEITNDIQSEYNIAHAQMEATAERLASKLACYGHGLLLKPVYNHNLPAMAYEDCAKQIINRHEDTWNAIVSIVKEVKHEFI